MSTSTFRTGDRAVVARPLQPTGHRAGESVTVLSVQPADVPGGRYLLQVMDDRGGVTGVWSTELDPA